MGVSINGGFSPKHPKMIIFSRKTHRCWVNPPFFGNPHMGIVSEAMNPTEATSRAHQLHVLKQSFHTVDGSEIR